ncbi:MAG TPA: hypothetical protein VF017_11125 [Thermoanaerobaculia bacterium]|nr:hypothetical protein [Thermoanaerobaculia bacterium]
MSAARRHLIQILLAAFLERGVDPFRASRRSLPAPARRERSLSEAELLRLQIFPVPRAASR